MTALLALASLCGAGTASASGLFFDGHGLPQARLEDCDPLPRPDWIDQVPERTARRVLPRDCALVGDRTPVYSWTDVAAPARQGPYTLTVQQRTGADAPWQAVLAVTTPRPRVLPAAHLSPGLQYRWQVSHGSVASAWRHFGVAPDALASSVPDAAAAHGNTLARAHPRLLPAQASWGELWAAAAAGGLAAPAARLMEEAQALVATAPPAEPRGRMAAAAVRDTAGAAALQLRKLALAYHLAPYAGREASREPLLQAARQRLQSLAGWHDGATSHETADQVNRDIFYALAIGYDLLHAQLGPDERRAVRQAVWARMATPLRTLGEFDGLPYRSHEANTLTYLVRTLALVAEDEPGDRSAHAAAWDAFLTLTSVWGEDDGATGNSIAYGWTDFNGIPETLYVLQAASGADVSSRAWFQRAVDFLIAMTPPGQSGPAAFGDTHDDASFAAYAHHTVRLHAAMVPRASSQWYWQQSDTRLNSDEVFWHLLALGLKRPPVPPQAPDSSYVSAGTGQVAFHTRIDGAPGVRSSVYFRSSRFGAWNHAHADQNAFVYHAQGTPLLINAGDYDAYATPHHLAVARATRYKNAITYDGGIGQAQDTATGRPVFSMNPSGLLLNAADTGPIAIATGDATAAYQAYDAGRRTWTPQLTQALRSIAFHRGERVLLVYDQLRADTPHRWEWNLQALNAFTVEGSQVSLPRGARGRACISLHGPAARFTQRRGFGTDPAPATPFAAQVHGRYTQDTASAETRSLMVIREDCATPLPALDQPEPGSARVTFADGHQVTFRDRTVQVD